MSETEYQLWNLPLPSPVSSIIEAWVKKCITTICVMHSIPFSKHSRTSLYSFPPNWRDQFSEFFSVIFQYRSDILMTRRYCCIKIHPKSAKQSLDRLTSFSDKIRNSERNKYRRTVLVEILEVSGTEKNYFWFHITTFIPHLSKKGNTSSLFSCILLSNTIE